MRDFLMCIAVALGVVAAILFLASIPGITHAWYSFIFFTVVLAGALAKMYWRARGRTRIWGLLGLFLVAHLAVYAALLHYVPAWPAFSYILTGPLEVILFIVIAKAWLDVMPTTTKF